MRATNGDPYGKQGISLQRGSTLSTPPPGHATDSMSTGVIDICPLLHTILQTTTSFQLLPRLPTHASMFGYCEYTPSQSLSVLFTLSENQNKDVGYTTVTFIDVFSSQYISNVVWFPLMGGLVFFLDPFPSILTFNFIEGKGPGTTNTLNKPGCHKNLLQYRLQTDADVYTHTYKHIHTYTRTRARTGGKSKIGSVNKT